MLKYGHLIPLFSAAVFLSGIAYGKELDIRNDLSLNEAQITKLPPDNFHLGLSAGFPLVFGIRGEEILSRSADLRPNWAITADIGLTAGLYASAMLEKRLGGSPFYAGLGYNFAAIFIGGNAGDMGWGGSANIHSALITIAARTTYQKAVSVCFTAGAMVQPWNGSDAAVLPMLRISLIRAD